ncbi:MAG: DUF2029 domain-containing protein [Acidobacteriota bacterium]|nr:DUF2029 domain-containing protein [Acidobacteriota bacterium]
MVKRRRLPLQTVVTVLVCCALWIALGSQIVGGARKHDFLHLYAGASFALEGRFADLQKPDILFAREREFVPSLDAWLPFVRPHFYALVLAPLALMPYVTAFWVWVGLQSALLVGCWYWAYRRWGPDALIFGALYLPTALGIASGQDCVMMLAILIGAYVLAERERDLPAGAVLALGMIKFHLFLLWPVIFLVQRRWRMLAGFAAVVAGEIGLSLLLAGPSGIANYIALLRRKDLEHLNPSPERMIDVHALALNFGTESLLVRGLLVAAVVALAAWASWRAPLWRWFAAATAGSLLIAPHVYGYDAGMLLLPVWLAIYNATDLGTRLAATALATPIPFLMTLAGKPWAAAAPIFILIFLANLAIRNLPTRRLQTPDEFESPRAHTSG